MSLDAPLEIPLANERREGYTHMYVEAALAANFPDLNMEIAATHKARVAFKRRMDVVAEEVRREEQWQLMREQQAMDPNRLPTPTRERLDREAIERRNGYRPPMTPGDSEESEDEEDEEEEDEDEEDDWHNVEDSDEKDTHVDSESEGAPRSLVNRPYSDSDREDRGGLAEEQSTVVRAFDLDFDFEWPSDGWQALPNEVYDGNVDDDKSLQDDLASILPTVERDHRKFADGASDPSSSDNNTKSHATTGKRFKFAESEPGLRSDESTDGGWNRPSVNWAGVNHFYVALNAIHKAWRRHQDRRTRKGQQSYQFPKVGQWVEDQAVRMTMYRKLMCTDREPGCKEGLPYDIDEHDLLRLVAEKLERQHKPEAKESPLDLSVVEGEVWTGFGGSHGRLLQRDL
jgi:hypothetical protein